MSEDKIQRSTTGSRLALWFARIALSVVFIVNVTCAVQFVLTPENFIGSYELEGVPGIAAVQGVGITFLMWNVTYPFAIAHPAKHQTVFIIVLIQQFVGLLGESFILLEIGEGYATLSTNLLRFITFDAFGLVLMLATFVWLKVSQQRNNDPRTT